MPTNAPGIQAVINTAPLGQPAPAQGSDAFFIVGYAIWGPMDVPTLVTSWNDYVLKFGGLHPDSDLARAVNLFFKNGGRRAWVVRAGNDEAQVSSITIGDNFAPPSTTLSVGSKYASDADAVDVRVTVSAGTTANTKKLVIESLKLSVREVFDNFKITLTTQEQADLTAGNSKFNDCASVTAKSKLVLLIRNTTNSHVAPANLPANGVYTLSGGTDPVGGIDSLSNSLALFTEDFGPGVLAAPGFPANNAAVVTQAESTKRIAILELEADDTATDAITARTALDSSYAAIYYPPRIRMQDLSGGTQIKEYSPVGAVAGIFAKAETEIGIHKAPANYRLTDVVGYDESLYGVVNDALRETLNERQINAIAKLPEQGIKVYGARVLKSYGRITAIHEQRILNVIYYRLKRSLQEFVFQPANQTLFREIRSTCAQYMRELYRNGALFSPTGNEDDAYRVICDESNNPPEQLQQHRVTVSVWAHLVGMAEMILIDINSVPLATDLDIVGGNQ